MRLIKMPNCNQGVVLLYAVLMVSIILGVSLSLLNITYKQIILTAVSRESQIAHFNAWGAVDCINRANRAFNDFFSGDDANNPFGRFNPTDSTLSLPTPPWSPPQLIFTCGDGTPEEIEIRVDQPAHNNTGPAGADGVSSSYKLTGLGLLGGCALVEAVKVESGNYDDFPGEVLGELDDFFFMITALGYNSSGPCDGTGNPRLVERRIRLKI